MKKYLVALDQGTTSSRAIVFDRSQQIVASAQKEFPQLYPQAGWVEHDPLELYSSQYGVMMEAITRGGIDPAEIAAIGITNQRETTIVWEKATGRPIYPAIVWQCRRTAALCDRLRADGLTTLHDLIPFVFCLYGVQVHCPCALEARSHPFPAVRAPVMSPTTKITAEEAFIWRLNSAFKSQIRQSSSLETLPEATLDMSMKSTLCKSSLPHLFNSFTTSRSPLDKS